MHSYHEVHGAFPPAAICDKNGKPLLSWRVLLLPYIDNDLFREFKLDEPWDSAQNHALLAKMPPVYSPFDGRPTPQAYTTYYRVFVGPGAAFESTRGLNLKVDFPDGLGNTILIVQAAEAVSWTKPAELPYGPTLPLPGLGGLYPNQFLVALADGGIRSIPATISEKTLRAAITRNGGEALDKDW
jgi:Protein of unknown function (DUF1559)